MTPKAKRKRQKDRFASDARVLEAARGTRFTGNETPINYQWHDGTLVHRVAKDRRSFYVTVRGQNNWMSRTAWVTLCDRVIAIDQSKFVASSRTPNCVQCMTYKKPEILVDWAKVIDMGVGDDA